MVHLGLAFLGPLRVTRDGELLTGFATSRVRALLAFLAMEAGRAHRRDALAGLLWPDMPTSSALTNLRHALSNLRAVIGGCRRLPAFFARDPRDLAVQPRERL